MTRRPTRLVAASTLLLTLSSLAFGAPPAPTPTTTPRATDGTTETDLRITIRLEEMRRQRNAYEADQLVARAVREEMAGRDLKAQELYARAVELDPMHERATTGLAATRDRLGLVVDPAPLLDRATRESRAKRQELEYRIEAALSAASDGIGAGTDEGFRKARLELDRARLARDAAVALYSAADLEAFEARLKGHDLALEVAIQNRNDARDRAYRAETRRIIKAARVHDVRLD